MQGVYVTLVMLNDNYIPGAIVLAVSLKQTATKYPIWCLIDNNVSPVGVGVLKKFFDNVVLVPLLTAKTTPLKSRKQRKIYGDWINHSFTKWNIFNPDIMHDQTTYQVFDKVLFLDADILVAENIDHIFDMETPAATFSSPWAKPYIPKFGITNPYGDKKHNDKVSLSLIKRGFNSIVGIGSVVLISPNQKSWQLCLNLLQTPLFGTTTCLSGHDEQLLATLFINAGKPARHIHPRFNWFVGKHHWLNYSHEFKPHVYHFYNIKPWNQKKDEWNETILWWKVAQVAIDTGYTSTYFNANQ